MEGDSWRWDGIGRFIRLTFSSLILLLVFKKCRTIRPTSFNSSPSLVQSRFTSDSFSLTEISLTIESLSLALFVSAWELVGSHEKIDR